MFDVTLVSFDGREACVLILSVLKKVIKPNHVDGHIFSQLLQL